MMGLIRKIIKALREGGIKCLYIRTLDVIKRRVFHINPEEAIAEQELQPQPVIYPPMVDVLFINGCGSLVPHPPRYRVTHQREQLIANNITSEEVFYESLQMDHLRFANMFVFFRCPHTPLIEEFIGEAKKLNKTVLFDIDDLVVDTVYTDTIKYIKEMTIEEKALYDSGVTRMGKTLKLCEGAITTTERLATELGKYVPEVFINRNTASERMYELSEKVVKDRDDDEVRIGYFSGSITHNDDFLLVMPALCKLMDKYKNVRLYIVGELLLPEELQPYESQIVVSPFMDWQELPQLISSVDINLGPLEQSIFNEAKSENKWVEAALVKVVTVASNVGAFARMIEHEKTGFLCEDNEWYDTLERLVLDKELRQNIAQNAYEYAKGNCITIYSGLPLAEHIRSKMRPSVAMSFPSTEISGGIMVALKHAAVLQKNGYNVTIVAFNPSLEWMEYDGCKFPVVAYQQNPIFASFDKAIATMWNTTEFLQVHPNIKQRYYLVQGYEVEFYEPNVVLRIRANQTYNFNNLKYVTVSKWCQGWLKDKYKKDATYVPNGIVADRFYPVERTFNDKIRILIEGDCSVPYKGVDESFQITNQLDPEKYEV
ncbi:MAG: glycosyltransferase, partial [Agathobacter sp.]|nr:glycosyltransferase [Agathobacter sp.]